MAAEPKLSVAFISLGCAKNTVDSQIMAGRLIKDGLVLSPSPEEADAIVINTCSFIKSARDESLDTIRQTCRLKENGRKVVIVAGCLPQKEQGKLADLLPEVDAFIGLDQLNSISQVIRSAANRKSVQELLSPASTRLFEPAVPGLAFSSGAYAYVKIAEGCDHPCAFCTIPSIRGRFRSRTPRAIVSEAEKLLETGFREITLVAQDSTAYGRDLASPSSLARLLKALDGIGGKFWVRFLYGFPGFITAELLETMASSERICRYLDVPVQHSHPEILRLMRRASTATHVARLPETARTFLPDVSLRTTVISGFPGEKKEHFDHLLNYLESSRFDHVGIFPYSPEAGTDAAAMKQVPAEVVSSRIEQLLELQSRIFDDKADALTGSCREVMLEAKTGKKTWIGRTFAQAPEVDSAVQVRVVSGDLCKGDFIQARITSHKGYTLRAAEFGMR